MDVLMATPLMKTGKPLVQEIEALGKAQIILRDAFKETDDKPKAESEESK